MKVGSIYVGIKGDTSPLDKSIANARRIATTGASKIQSAFDTIKGSALALGAASAVVAGGFYALNRVMDEAKSLANIQEKEERKLEAVLKATGNAAGFTADELKKLASRYQSVTTTGDEVILSGMSILATFKNVRKEGFERATMAALDMSEVMGQSLNGSITMIGKALNDPIKGLSSLSRVGVTFTEQQKNQIKTLQESGDIYKAQGVILKELESQFGGVAKSMVGLQSGALAQLGNTWGDVLEVIGQTETQNADLTTSYRDLDTALQEQSENIAFLFDLYGQGKTVIVDLATGFVGAAENVRAFVATWQAFKDLTRGTITVQQYFDLDTKSLLKYGKLRNSLELIADTQRKLTVERSKWFKDESKISDLEEELAYQQQWKNELLTETTQKTAEQTAAQKAQTNATMEQLGAVSKLDAKQDEILEKAKDAFDEKVAAEEEMYQEAGIGAEKHYAAEASDLVKKVANWQAAGADVYESEQWLYDQLGKLSEEAWQKGETAAGLAMDSMMAQSSTLVDEMNRTISTGLEELESYGVKIDSLDGSSIGITAALDGSGVISGIDTLIEKFEQLRVASSGTQQTATSSNNVPFENTDPSLSAAQVAALQSSQTNNTTVNINQKISRSDVTAIITEQDRQGARL